MFKASPRFMFFLAFVACLLIIAGALYLEHYVGLVPCPMCVVQRMCVIVFGLICLLAALHGPGVVGRKIYSLLGLLVVILGATVASRQIWLQSQPVDQLEACLPSLEFMVQALPWQEVVGLLFKGTADCAEVSWTLFTLSLPEWSLLAFIGMGLFSLWQLLRR